MRDLTDIQRKTLDFVREYARDQGVMPSRSEIAEGLGVRHKSAIDARLLALQAKGWIELRAGSPRFIRLLKEDLPLLIAGPIAAGEPILADERIRGQIPRAIADWFPQRPDFFLRVEGDSMNRLGLVTGTVVAVKAQPVAENRDVVVARFEDHVTLKRFVIVDERRAELHPESTNPAHRSIDLDLESDAFEIAGVAVGALIGDGFNRPEDDLGTT